MTPLRLDVESDLTECYLSCLVLSPFNCPVTCQARCTMALLTSVLEYTFKFLFWIVAPV
jgi:hypothetical protein